MQEFLLYRPNKTEILILFIFFPLAIILLTLAFLTDGILDKCVLLFMAVLEFCFGFYFYHNSFRILALGQDEIQVFNRKLLRKYLWTDFSEAYYTTNFKNFPFLVISGEKLSKKQLKYFCNHCEKRFEDVVVIPIGNATRDERKAIVELIEKHEIEIHKGKYDII